MVAEFEDDTFSARNGLFAGSPAYELVLVRHTLDQRVPRGCRVSALTVAATGDRERIGVLSCVFRTTATRHYDK